MARVVIYTTNYCSYCRAAKALLSAKKIQFEEIDVTYDAGRRAEMERLSRRWTVPEIFIDGTPIGGFDELRQLDVNGELDRLIRQTG